MSAKEETAMKKIAAALTSSILAVTVGLGTSIYVSAMEIYVDFSDDKRITLEVSPEDTIGSIKSKIQEKEGISPAQQCVYYEGTLLEEGHKLSDYDIQEKSVLTFVLGSKSVVSYVEQPSYMLTIPASVTFSGNDVTEHITLSGFDGESAPILNPGQKLLVLLTDAENGFDGTNLTVKSAENASAVYNVIGNNNMVLGKNGVAAEFVFDPDNDLEHYSKDIIFKAPENIIYAGKYTDKLTFTVTRPADDDF